MMNLLNSFRVHCGQLEGDAARKLRETYARFDNPKPDDAAELAAVLPVLGLGRGDAIKDLMALAEYRKLEAEREPLAQKAGELLKELGGINAELLALARPADVLYQNSQEGKRQRTEAERQTAFARRDIELRAGKAKETYGSVRRHLDDYERRINALKSSNLRAFSL